jgi:DNA-binding beta-propeller fold protein YncE
VAFDPQSRLLYIGETDDFNSVTNGGALRVFNISGNTLTEFTYSQPYAPAGTGPHAILPTPDGKYVYVASWGSAAPGAIAGYSVTTSALTAVGTTVPTGTEPYGLAEDSTGSYVLAVSSTGTTFDAYTFDATTAGQLDSSFTDSSLSAPIAIVALPK